jgi:hypothetical protein
MKSNGRLPDAGARRLIPGVLLLVLLLATRTFGESGATAPEPGASASFDMGIGSSWAFAPNAPSEARNSISMGVGVLWPEGWGFGAQLTASALSSSITDLRSASLDLFGRFARSDRPWYVKGIAGAAVLPGSVQWDSAASCGPRARSQGDASGPWASRPAWHPWWLPPSRRNASSRWA